MNGAGRGGSRRTIARPILGQTPARAADIVPPVMTSWLVGAMAPDAGALGWFRGPLPLLAVERHRGRSVTILIERQHEPHRAPSAAGPAAATASFGDGGGPGRRAESTE